MPIRRQLTADNIADLKDRTVLIFDYDKSDHALYFRLSSDGTYGGFDTLLITDVRDAPSNKADEIVGQKISQLAITEQNQTWNIAMTLDNGINIAATAGHVDWTVSITH